GYGGDKDLTELDENFTKHAFPCDGLWLDLDYMDGYRVFTVDDAMFPEGTQPTAERLAKSGRRMVPILDPGLKQEGGYEAYDEAQEADILCRNPEGGEYVGLVWPGETVFPDFTLQEGRDWWAARVSEFAKRGFGGVWCDMNDPSTGPVDPHGMLFGRGLESHASYRNEYALGMVRATYEGFLWTRPEERPFILTRSASAGSAKYAAVWTGDNMANRFYLANSIPCCLGMSLSGLPFCGPDLGGFGGVADEALMLDWTKANFLFPFLRNHADRNAGRKEPWAFGKAAMNTLRRYVRLRYKLLPYLYNLFADAEMTGDPVLRPLFYHFGEEGLDEIDDQFMVGPWVMQAPFVDDTSKTRNVVLPGSEPWCDAASGDWVVPEQTTVRRGKESTPLYFRTGAVVPMRPGTPTSAAHDLCEVSLHVFVPEGWNGEREFEYVADDGLSYGYRRGERSVLRGRLVSADGHIAISTSQEEGYGPIEASFVFHGPVRSVRIDSADAALIDETVTLTGKPLRVKTTKAL
ncbi:alpha-glucosidase, partial [bacterium]